MLCYPPSPITPRVVRGEIDLTEDFPPLRKTDMTKPDTNTRGRQHKLKMKKQNNKKMLSLHHQDRINITEHASNPDSSHTNTHDTPASDPPHTDTLNQNTHDSHTVDTSDTHPNTASSDQGMSYIFLVQIHQIKIHPTHTHQTLISTRIHYIKIRRTHTLY